MPLSELVVKELKNTLRDRKILITVIVMPLIIFAVMGFAYNYGLTRVAEEATERVREAKVLVCDLDSGNYSVLVIKFAESFAKEVHVIHEYNPSFIREVLSSGTYTLVLTIPEGFSTNVSRFIPAKIRVEAAVKGISMSSLAIASVINGIAESLNAYVRAYVAVLKGINATFIANPIVPDLSILFRNAELSPSTLSMLATSAMLLSLAPLIVVSTALGISSSSMAVENEEKTLEILLTLPISRFKIVLSKLLGTLVLVVLATISYIGGFILYLTLLFKGIGVTEGLTQSVSNAVSNTATASLFIVEPSLMVLIATSTLISLISVASLGLLLGSIVPDVRTSQTYIGQLAVLIIVPGLVLSFIDLSSIYGTPLIALIALSPFISPILVLKAYLEGLIWIGPTVISWFLAFSALVLYIASKLINSERLLTLQFRLLTRRVKERKSR